MTFDDGPCRPRRPDSFGGKPLTLVLAETLGGITPAAPRRGGDTSGNYPDTRQHGSASWGGVA